MRSPFDPARRMIALTTFFFGKKQMEETNSNPPKKIGRPSEITDAQVIEAGLKLKAQGVTVNASNLRKEVKGGAKDRLFQIWEDYLNKQQLPDEVSAVIEQLLKDNQVYLNKLVRETFSACERVAASRYTAQEAAMLQQCAELKQEVQDSDVLIQELEDQLQQERELRQKVEGELAAALAVIKQHAGEVKAIQLARDDVQHRLDAANEVIADLRTEVGGLKEARSTDQETIRSLRQDNRDIKLSLDAVCDVGHQQKSEIARLTEKVKGLEKQVTDKERLLVQSRTENSRLTQLLARNG
ncbi:DNA-binding protein [Pseudomonas aeruginosa]|nr:DNA-binding protein [Pseudomonas aeruginosa]ELD5772961.1 DNA-binding protein [Pseudomonas aeruginosa]MBH4464997.1 DNA-binding protein [Pseudomonas aeruginosa]MCC0300991.1 DNA-binding protein [Pseudomonas aeruginosa]MCC0408390.1 DNA-binding protein [Pseudomonas aeruginosa]MCC0433532.1 DNA-binding protein [Pseudomonas aeruginosa]